MALRPSAAQPSALLVLAVVSRVTQAWVLLRPAQQAWVLAVVSQVMEAWVRPLVAQQASVPLERLEEPLEELGQLAVQALESVRSA